MAGFDIDCVKVAFDGKNVVAAPRAIYSFMKGYNILNICRTPINYFKRLIKYSKRGWAVKIPIPSFELKYSQACESPHDLEFVVNALLITDQKNKSQNKEVEMFTEFDLRIAETEEHQHHTYYLMTSFPFGKGITTEQAFQEIDKTKLVHPLADVRSFNPLTLKFKHPDNMAAFGNCLLYKAWSSK